MPQRYAGQKILVGGAGIAGGACARVLLELGADVTVIDRVDSDRLAGLGKLGAHVVVGETPDPAALRRIDQVVVSPGYPPHHPLVAAAAKAGLEIYSEPELAWRLREPGQHGAPPPWLAITGTNGKTTAATMLSSILAAAGLHVAALGNIGEPLVDAVLRPPAEQHQVLAVELSSFQLHWSSQLAPQIGALLNLADDHLDWHGGFGPYAAAKRNVFRAAGASGASGAAPEWGAPAGVAVGNLDDPRVAELLRQTPGRRVGFTLGAPEPGQFGVVDGVLLDRAFAVIEGVELVELIDAAQVRPGGSHNVANALAAAAVARAYGAPASAVRDGLVGYAPAPHRNALVREVAEVVYVDDSKATNPHAATSSLTSYPRVVWIAGGQLKGVDVAPLVAAAADRLVGAVLIGTDRALIAEALARHAPHVPVVDIERTDDGAMAEAVQAARALARSGDTVLLAPAAASFDMFTSYADRGDRFAAVVVRLPATDR